MAVSLLQRDPDAELRLLAYIRRRKITRLTVTGILVLVIIFLGFYHFSDFVLGPSKRVNSDSLAGEWAMFRHDPAHTGSTNLDGNIAQGVLNTALSTNSIIHSSPAIANGIVYVGSRDCTLYALDATTFAKLWEFKTESWIQSSPVVVDGVVYFGSNDGHLYALDALTGEKVWEFKARYAIGR